MTPDLSAPGPLAESAAAKLSLAVPCARLSLRARGAAVAPLSAALGLTLPERIGTRASTAAGDTEALRLGPDEWVLHATPAALPGLLAACAALSPEHPHSAVDISGRELTLVLEGPRAAELLTLGMPRDPDSIAPGEGRRTLFDGVSVVLWREADTRFRMDIWHSFAPHLASLLATGCAELAAETA